MFGKDKLPSRIINPYEPPKNAKIEIQVDLVTQQCAVTCNVTLPAFMMADILIQSASGILKQLQQQEAMIIGRGGVGMPKSPAPIVSDVTEKQNEV
jgi:hypothetical protein